MTQSRERVAIIGASEKPDRYSYKAFQMLKEYGHTPIPIHPRLKSIDGVACFESLAALKSANQTIDTVTMYVNPTISSSMESGIVALKPKRVIFNPGSENPALAQALLHQGITPVEACTLVLLRTAQF